MEICYSGRAVGVWRLYYSRHMYPNPNTEPHYHLCTYQGKHFSAWAAVWTSTWPSRASITAPGGGVAIWTIFEFLGGLVIYSSYQVCTTTCLKSFRYLWVYPGKVFSAWTEVWTGTWPSRSFIIPSGGRDLGDF